MLGSGAWVGAWHGAWVGGCSTTWIVGLWIGEVGPEHWGSPLVVVMSLMGYCYMKWKRKQTTLEAAEYWR